MLKGIVLKLFLLTTALCLFLVAMIFAAQTVFFKQFYMHQKVSDVKAAVQTFKQDYLKTGGKPNAAAELEQKFYREHNIWIAALDEMGYLQYSADFEMEVRLEQAEGFPDLDGQTLTIPLYTVANVDDFSADNPLYAFGGTWVQEGQPIAIEGLMMKGRLIPQRMARGVSGLREENRLENTLLANKEYEVVPRFESPVQYHEKYPSALVQGRSRNLRCRKEPASPVIRTVCFWSGSKLFRRTCCTVISPLTETAR